MDQSIPSYSDLMLPVVRAVRDLGGSGAAREITEAVIQTEGFSEEMLAVTFEGRAKSVLIDRLDWARSYSKVGGVLESPKRGLFLITDLGSEIAALPDDQANDRLKEIDHTVRLARPKKATDQASSPDVDDEESPDVEDGTWREVLLTRLHQLSPDAFEHFVLSTPLPWHGTETGGWISGWRSRRHRDSTDWPCADSDNCSASKAVRAFGNGWERSHGASPR